jgi:peptide deformylase
MHGKVLQWNAAFTESVRRAMMDNKLVYYGNETLRKKALPVESFTAEIGDISAHMHQVMRKARGIGLAAPQIDLSLRIVTIDLTHADGPALTLVNPVIVADSGEDVVFEEGCLSLPGIFRDVVRPDAVTVQALDVDGRKFEIEADGMLARVLQHEIDHLDGVLFIDRIEEHVLRELSKELKKIKKMNG